MLIVDVVPGIAIFNAKYEATTNTPPKQQCQKPNRRIPNAEGRLRIFQLVHRVRPGSLRLAGAADWLVRARRMTYGAERAKSGNPNQRGNRNGLGRGRQRQTQCHNPNADRSQNPIAPVVPPVSPGGDRRRRGARRGARGKVRAENSNWNWRGGAATSASTQISAHCGWENQTHTSG